MANLRIEQRADGSLLLTYTGAAHWGLATAGIGSAVLLLGALAVGDVRLLGGVLILPLAFIALLAGVAAVRHRDWILFDRPAREISHRRGLTSMFRTVSVVPFDEVEAIVVEPDGRPGDAVEVQLLRAGDFTWSLDTGADPGDVSRLVTALHEVGGWPIRRKGGVAHAPLPDRRLPV